MKEIKFLIALLTLPFTIFGFVLRYILYFMILIYFCIFGDSIERELANELFEEQTKFPKSWKWLIFK